MKTNEVQIGGVYTAKVNDQLTHVRIEREVSTGGWEATNLVTSRKIRIRTARKLRGPADHATAQRATAPPATSHGAPTETADTAKTAKRKATSSGAKATEKKLSALDAAAKVLSESGEPLNSKQMVEAMSAKGYWTSPEGKTPHATLYSAILREIGQKGDDSRFLKTERGKFTLVRR